MRNEWSLPLRPLHHQYISLAKKLLRCWLPTALVITTIALRKRTTSGAPSLAAPDSPFPRHLLPAPSLNTGSRRSATSPSPAELHQPASPAPPATHQTHSRLRRSHSIRGELLSSTQASRRSVTSPSHAESHQPASRSPPAAHQASASPTGLRTASLRTTDDTAPPTAQSFFEHSRQEHAGLP